MTELEEIMRFGEVMYRIMPDGTRKHIPREQWCADYNPEHEKHES